MWVWERTDKCVGELQFWIRTHISVPQQHPQQSRRNRVLSTAALGDSDKLHKSVCTAETGTECVYISVLLVQYAAEVDIPVCRQQSAPAAAAAVCLCGVRETETQWMSRKCLHRSVCGSEKKWAMILLLNGYFFTILNSLRMYCNLSITLKWEAQEIKYEGNITWCHYHD